MYKMKSISWHESLLQNENRAREELHLKCHTTEHKKNTIHCQIQTVYYQATTKTEIQPAAEASPLQGVVTQGPAMKALTTGIKIKQSRCTLRYDQGIKARTPPQQGEGQCSIAAHLCMCITLHKRINYNCWGEAIFLWGAVCVKTPKNATFVEIAGI